ncbi:ead/Ea22-like family protein [Serratia marcescens]|uniref:ead/Ea22-like family protein n=1 Tax=Serratia marcescens TaxID=615 RepID=UPI003204E2AF
MDNKLSELSKPVAWRYRYTKPGITDSHGEAWVGDWKFVTDEVNCNPAPNYQKCALYSQEYVSALLAELEESKQYTKERDAENESLALTVGRLRVELEAKG